MRKSVNINQENFDITRTPDNNITTATSFVTTAASVVTPSTTTTSFFNSTNTAIPITTSPFMTTTNTSIPITIAGSTISDSSINLSNTSMWFDPRYIDYWTNTFSPIELKYKPYNVTLYNTKDPDPNGILKPTATNPGVIFNNYMKIAFDNTKSDYNSFTQNPIVFLQTKIKNIPIGNYLMTYYVSSSTNTTDTQSISVTSGVNSEIGTPFILRNFVNGGTWVKQQYAFSIIDNTFENTIQFQFELFDIKSPGLSILAVGGINIQSCGNQPCNIECTTYYTDWGVCDVTNGISIRNAELTTRNNDTTCPIPLTTGSCLNTINFTNGLTDWNIKTTPIDALTNNFIKIPVFTPSTITDAYQFSMNNIPFNTPFIVVNFVNNKINTFNKNINPTVTITTSLKLQTGNYRISYYVQSSETQQLINVSNIIGNGLSAITTQTIPSNVVNPLEWYLITTNFLVTKESVVPIQFIFTLKDTKPLINSAIALGGINISYCGNQPCEILQSKSTKPYSFTTTPYNSYTITSPVSHVTNTVSTKPESCYSDWSDCRINFNNNITNDMLTNNIKKDIESVIQMSSDSNKQLAFDQFINNYNDVLSKYYTKTRKLTPYASESCINSATLHDLLMTNC